MSLLTRKVGRALVKRVFSRELLDFYGFFKEVVGEK